MSTSPHTTFDYSTLNETASTQVKAALATIRRNSRSTVKAALTIGMALLDAKRILDHGQFKPWVIAQCGFSVRTAERYMRIATLLEDKYDTLSHLQISTIYRLSEKSLPEPILQQILAAMAEEGPLSDIQVEALLNQLLQVEASAAQCDSVIEPRSHLMSAWLAASEADRNELVSSVRSVLASSAWQALSATERAAFVTQRSDELTALLSARPDEAANETDAEAGNVVQLFADAPSIVEESSTEAAVSSFERTHN